MESPIELLKRLISEGEKFNFQNFCFPCQDYPGRYGGDDTPEWLAWKTRCRNLIAQLRYKCSFRMTNARSAKRIVGWFAQGDGALVLSDPALRDACARKSGGGPPHSTTLRAHESHTNSRQRPGLRQFPGAFPRLPIRAQLKFIRHRNSVSLEPVDGFHHRRRSRAFKPCRRAPRILTGHRHQPVFHRVLMDIVQPRQI